MIHTYTDSHIQEDQKDTSELHKRKPKITEYSTKAGWVHRTPDGIQILAKTILPTAHASPWVSKNFNTIGEKNMIIIRLQSSWSWQKYYLWAYTCILRYTKLNYTHQMQKVVDILGKAMAHGQSSTAPSQIYKCAVRISSSEWFSISLIHAFSYKGKNTHVNPRR